MTKILAAVNGFVWGIPALVMILGVGIYLSVRTGFVQLRLFPRALREFFRQLFEKNTNEGISGFRALCTALGATVGTGNLVGVAGAICLGGPGSIFWMWVCGLLGMATKFAEAALAVRFRVRRGNGWVGGPMYIISRGMGGRWNRMAALYSFFGIVAAFGVGNATQINAVISGINACTGRESPLGNLLLGILLAIFVGFMLFGGAGRIGAAAEKLVPAAAAAYMCLCAAVLIVRHEAILPALRDIVQGAFSPRAVTGGAFGSGYLVLRVGCSRGVFTNEAGMGTASIAHGSAEVKHPVQQGLLGIMEVFLDTIVICTLTALVILCSGVVIPYGVDLGGMLTSRAFSAVCGDWVNVVLAAAMCCFALATVLGWGLYGARCAEYLFGSGAWKWFALGQTLTVILGAVLKTGIVWMAAETVNGLMAIPNLIALAVLSPELLRLIHDYEKSGL